MSPSSTSDSSTRESYLDDDLLGEGGLLPFQRLKLDDASDSSLPAPVGTNGLNGLINGQINRQTKGQATGQTNAQKGSVRLVIGIDYGTTFTGVAYAIPRSNIAKLEDIRTISTWGTKMTNHFKIPSVFSYSRTDDGQHQWGANISPSAVTMVNTKLELDVQDNKIEELELLLQVLDGTCNLKFEHVRNAKGDPEYTWRDPEHIVTDYLTEIFKVVQRTFQDSGTHAMGHVPVDIVITVPVNWSYRAKNSTLQAIRKAGFNEDNFPNLNDIIMITEPEAAAIFTARHLKEEKKQEFLKVKDCFVLCDAGGGTVDAVAYRVKQLEPTLELERFSNPTSAKVGSSYIDANFKRWLRDTIGDEKYGTLDPNIGGEQVTNTMEGALVRRLVKSFDQYKKTFSNTSPDVRFELPLPDRLPEPKPKPIHVPGRVDRGILTITNKEMKNLFDPCVDGVIELILGQIHQVSKQGHRVKNVFLVGGFGESPYLQEELKISLNRRSIPMRRPDQRKAWTAVVEGAVMYGIEKANYRNVVTMATCSRSYGIKINQTMRIYKYDKTDVIRNPVTNKVMAQHQMIWLIRRGDLLLSNVHKEMEERIVYQFTNASARKFELPIYEYPNDDEMEPGRFQDAQHELETVAVLDIDLSKVPLSNFDQGNNPRTGAPYFSAPLILKMKLFDRRLVVQILMDDEIFCETAIDDLESETSRERANNR